jgi:hypothetical protein
MSDIERKAAEHGINVFRMLLEDDEEPYEDALRVGMQSAASDALQRVDCRELVDRIESLEAELRSWQNAAAKASAEIIAIEDRLKDAGLDPSDYRRGAWR